jgi:hypothetical protein
MSSNRRVETGNQELICPLHLRPICPPLNPLECEKYGGLVRGAPVMKKQGRIEGSGDAFGIGKQMFPFLPAVGVVQPICPIH